ncbi:MAG: hypothetical protein A2720_00400 [Candidatus Doudnabacteria bacterium RIFCSPHIGHO2_01_FULL_46_24]|uniref:Uncharacterized protein n=1 Tax=Candidatus Doudnabacteria bacterium RIFCSPHIGHO2_01_FULL_46_24 TaxID=1817825 RepID=A0A1F5NU97_9BACT|nr:MAG: hypothetical protein A2720_00400 [Candidatus Doudnabacteria bacterium RIFCSPHIGHO2_01_FULL_46_24]
MSSSDTLYFAAIFSSVSSSKTLWLTPVVGRTVNFWPGWRTEFSSSLFSIMIVAGETPKLEAIEMMLSPGTTSYTERPARRKLSVSAGLVFTITFSWIVVGLSEVEARITLL